MAKTLIGTRANGVPLSICLLRRQRSLLLAVFSQLILKMSSQLLILYEKLELHSLSSLVAIALIVLVQTLKMVSLSI